MADEIEQVEFLAIFDNKGFIKKLAPLRLAVKDSGDLVRKLKAENAPKIEIDRAVVELKAHKKKLEEMVKFVVQVFFVILSY